MKKVFTLALVLLFGAQFAIAQDESQKPVVMYPVYFDVSPPLRDMVLESDNMIDNSWKEGIVKNKLNAFTQEEPSTDAPVPDPVRQSFFGALS